MLVSDKAENKNSFRIAELAFNFIAFLFARIDGSSLDLQRPSNCFKFFLVTRV